MLPVPRLAKPAREDPITLLHTWLTSEQRGRRPLFHGRQAHAAALASRALWEGGVEKKEGRLHLRFLMPHNRQGFLVVEYPGSNDKYEGEWVLGKKEGKGRYTSNTGDVYEGEFRAGTRNGVGMYRYGSVPGVFGPSVRPSLPPSPSLLPSSLPLSLYLSLSLSLSLPFPLPQAFERLVSVTSIKVAASVSDHPSAQ